MGNQLVHALGKWYTKCRTGKFRPRIAFSISTNQLPKNDHKGLKLVSKNALKKWNMNFCLEYSFWIINRITFSNVPFLLEIFCQNDLNICVSFTFQPDFLKKLFVNGKTTLITTRTQLLAKNSLEMVLHNIPIISRQVSLLNCDQFPFINACWSSSAVICPDLSLSTVINQFHKVGSAPGGGPGGPPKPPGYPPPCAG